MDKYCGTEILIDEKIARDNCFKINKLGYDPWMCALVGEDNADISVSWTEMILGDG
jgi:hypothetical protein